MRLVTLTLACALAWLSCNASPTAKKMASETCAAMVGYDPADQASVRKTLSSIEKVLAKEKEYTDVSEAALSGQMHEMCPKGWAAFQELTRE